MLTTAEFERLVNLFPPDTILPARVMAALMANNSPSVARKWLEENGLLDDQQATAGGRS